METSGRSAPKRRRYATRLALTLLFAPVLFGAGIPCATGTYADYEALGQCMIGDFTLFGFTFGSSSIPAQGNSGAGSAHGRSNPGGSDGEQRQLAEPPVLGSRRIQCRSRTVRRVYFSIPDRSRLADDRQ